MTIEQCPICGAAGVAVSVGAWGYVAHCSQCYDGDPEAPRWCHMQGRGDTPEQAVERWLDDARDLATIDVIPSLRAPVQLGHRDEMFEDLERQVAAEAELQRGLDLVPGWRWVLRADGSRVAEDIIYAEFCS